eukprot:5418576-Amphidinium_carterae.2
MLRVFMLLCSYLIDHNLPPRRAQTEQTLAVFARYCLAMGDASTCASHFGFASCGWGLKMLLS